MARSARTPVPPPPPVRAGPLDGQSPIVRPGVTVTPADPARRLSLRAPQSSLTAIGKALGLSLPRKPLRLVAKGARTAVWLGPDEWLLIDEGGDPLADCAGLRVPHAAVDISHRNVALLVEGSRSEAALSAGCPLDLSDAAFPVGSGTRTVMGKIEVVILRTGDTAFRVECWRSLADYAFGFLREAARDAAN